MKYISKITTKAIVRNGVIDRELLFLENFVRILVLDLELKLFKNGMNLINGLKYEM